MSEDVVRSVKRSLGALLTKIREEGGMTVRTLARGCGVSRSRIRRLQEGAGSCPADLVSKVLAVLRVYTKDVLIAVNKHLAVIHPRRGPVFRRVLV